MEDADKILKALEDLKAQNDEREKQVMAQRNKLREELLSDIETLSGQLDEEFDKDEFKDADLKQLKVLKRGFEKAVNFSQRQVQRASRIDPLSRVGNDDDGMSNKDMFFKVVDMVCLSMNLPIRETVEEDKREMFDEVNHELEIELYNRGIRF